MQGVYGKCVTQRHWFFWWAGATNLTVIGDHTKKALVHGGSTHYYNAALMHQRVKYARHVPQDVRRLFCQGYLRVWILFLQGGKPTRLIMTFVSGKGRRDLQWFVSTTILWVPLTLLFHNSSFTRLKCVSPCFCRWRLLYVKHSYQNNWCQLSAAIDDTHLSHSVAITLHYSTQLSTPVCVAQSNISRVACSPWWTHCSLLISRMICVCMCWIRQESVHVQEPTSYYNTTYGTTVPWYIIHKMIDMTKYYTDPITTNVYHHSFSETVALKHFQRPTAVLHLCRCQLSTSIETLHCLTFIASMSLNRNPYFLLYVCKSKPHNL